MKTLISATSILVSGFMFIVLFVLSGSFVMQISSQYFESSYAYAVLILNFLSFTILMSAMMFAITTIERYFG